MILLALFATIDNSMIQESSFHLSKKLCLDSRFGGDANNFIIPNIYPEDLQNLSAEDRQTLLLQSAIQMAEEAEAAAADLYGSAATSASADDMAIKNELRRSIAEKHQTRLAVINDQQAVRVAVQIAHEIVTRLPAEIVRQKEGLAAKEVQARAEEAAAKLRIQEAADRQWSQKEIKQKFKQQDKARRIYFKDLAKRERSQARVRVVRPVVERTKAAPPERAVRPEGTLSITDLYNDYGLNWKKLQRILPRALNELGLPETKEPLERIYYPAAIKEVLEKQNPELKLETIDLENWYSINRIFHELRDGDYCNQYQTAENAMAALEEPVLEEIKQILSQTNIADPALSAAAEHLQKQIASRPIELTDVCRQFREEKRAYHRLMYLLMMPKLKEHLGKFEDKPANELLVSDLVANLAADFHIERANFSGTIVRILQSRSVQASGLVRRRKLKGFGGPVFCCDSGIIDILRAHPSLMKFKK